MVEQKKDIMDAQHLLDMIDKGKTSAKPETEPEWKEPMPKEIDFAQYLTLIKENKADLSVQFKPKNFAKFLNTGVYQPLTLSPGESSQLQTNVVFIVGCGRSGTTLLFNLIQPSD